MGLTGKGERILKMNFWNVYALKSFQKTRKVLLFSPCIDPQIPLNILHEKFNIYFAQLLSQLNDAEATVLGDLNVNLLIKSNNKELNSIMQLYGFDQLIKKPTRIDNDTKSLIDIIASNHRQGRNIWRPQIVGLFW